MNDLIIKNAITDLTEEKTNLILTSFAPIVKTLTDYAKDLPGIEAMDDGKDKCEKAKRFRIDFGRELTRADKVRKDLKEDSLREGKSIQSVYNYIKKATEDTKTVALDIELHYERIEEEKRKALQAARASLLLRYEVDGSDMDLGNMADEIWLPYLTGLKTTYEAEKEAEKKAEVDRIDTERILYLHADRKNSILHLWNFILPEYKDENFGLMSEFHWLELVEFLKESDRVEREKQAKVAAENELLRVEAAAKEAALQAEREEAQRILRIENENLRVAKEVTQRLEREQANVEAERLRVEQEKAAVIAEAQRKAQMAPDKEKLISLIVYMASIRDIVQSPDAKNIIQQAEVIIGDFASYL